MAERFGTLAEGRSVVDQTTPGGAPKPSISNGAVQHNLIDRVRYADDEVDRLAIDDFEKHYAETDFSGVCVLIPAYEEEGSIAKVLTKIPETVCGLRTSTLVVVDGGKDRTGEIVRDPSHGAYACICSRNRGQGAALRLGYRLAIRQRADYIVIVDADGQWDPAQMEALLEPLITGKADFVQGSRRLGQANNPDSVRAAGVVVFATMINVLTHSHITDSSSGFRAFRSEVVADLTLEQDQYQSSELLIGVISKGFRIAEVPVIMSTRSAGKSKKGGNFVYGSRYARVILRTWLREAPPGWLRDRPAVLDRFRRMTG